MAQLVIAAAGAALGGALAPAGFAFLGMTGAQLGWMAGSLAGSMLNKPPGQAGPRLDDSALRVTGTEYGQCIPWVAGSPRLPGIIIWASDRRETATTEEVGKGGGQEYTTYSYDIDVLYLVADQPGCVITRIWMNGRLAWTSLASSDDASRLASDGTEKWRRLTIYDGADDQLPDPTYDAAVANAPAYRGRTTVFIEGLQLGNSGALPNFTFEVCSDAGESDEVVRRYSVEDIGAANRYTHGTTYWGLGVPFIRRIVPSIAVESYAPSPLGSRRRGATIEGAFGDWPSGFSPATVGDWNGNPLNLYAAPGFSHPVALIDGQAVRLQRHWSQTATTGGTGAVILSIGTIDAGVTSGGADLTAVLPSGLYVGATFPCSDGQHVLICTAATAAGGGGQPLTHWHLVRRVSGVSTLVRSGTIDNTGLSLTLGTSIHGHGSFTSFWAGALEDDLTHVWAAQGASTRPVIMCTIGEDGVMRLGDRLETGGGIPSVTISEYGGTSCWAEAGYCVVVCGGTYSAFRRAGTAIREVPLRRVVEDLCGRAGMPAGTYDASALAAITRPVRALAIPQVASARATLDMLMTSHQFVAALSDKLYFFPRGTTVDATIAWGDLGTGEGDASDDPLAIQVGNDLELPAQMAVQYRNMTADQQTGVEYSDRVISGQASVQPMQMALGMLPSEAKGVADALQLDGIAAQVSASVSVPLTYAKLWPGSVVTLIGWDGAQYRMRVTRREDDGLMLKLDVVGDDQAALTSASITDGSYTVVQTVQALDGTSLEVLDIPILRDDDDALGYYVAARAQSSGRWPGAVVQASRDTVNYRTVATVSEPAVIGQTTGALQNWTRGAIMDEVSFVDVNVGAGELSSVTREQLLADASVNAMLIGSEVIRFATATLQSASPNVYRLRRLLRGQRGTEWAMAGHAIGERVVLLRPRGLRRVASDAADLAVPQSVRAATVGTVASDAAPESFTLAGVGLKPFAPTNLRKASAGSSTVLTWERRTRRRTVVQDGLGILHPLGEAVEQYHVEVYDAGNVLLEQQTVTGTTSATLGAPVAIRSWLRDGADVFEYGGHIYARSPYGAGGGVQKYDAARALVSELASVASYGDSTTRVARMVHDGAGTAYLLLTPQLTAGGGIASQKVLRLSLSSMSVTGACDVYASAAASYTGLHFYSGAVYVAGSDGAGSTILARVTASTMAFGTSVTIAGVGSYAVADDGAGNVCMVVGTQYRPYDASTLTAGAPVTLASSIYARELVRVGSVLWAHGYGDVSVTALAMPSGSAVATGSVGMLSASPIAVLGGSVVMQAALVVATPGSTVTAAGDLVVYNASTGALQQRIPFADRYLGGVVGSNYVGNAPGSGGAYVATEYGAPGSMSGGRAVVYQISATVGRGYPAEITL